MKKQLFTLALGIMAISAFSQSTIWQPYNSNLDTSYYVRYISVVDTNTVWGIGFNGGTNPASNMFTRTIDGADFHSGTFLSDTNTYAPSNISATDANTAYIAAYVKTASASMNGQLLKTTNGGAMWTNVAATGSTSTTGMFLGANNFPDWVYFWNANNGIALGDPNGSTTNSGTDMFEIWRTNNGGTSWTRVADANVPVPQTGEYGQTNSFTTYKKWLWSGTSDGRVYASADSGKTWTVGTGTTGLASGVFGLAFRDSLHGLVWGLPSSTATVPTVLNTSDGGNTWTAIAATSSLGISAISTIPGTKSYMSVGLNATASGYVTSVTYNDGANWNVLETGTTNPVRMLSIQMLDSSAYGYDGWAGCFSTNTLPYGTNGMDRYRLGHKLGCPITLTSASSSTPFNVCSAGSATITASGLNTYTWSTSATTASITVTPSVTTSYSVAGTTTAGCANYETFNINVVNPVVTVASHTICEGASINLAAVGATTYSWSPATGLDSTNVATVVASPTSTTVYTITGTEDLCNATSTATVTIKPAPSITITSSTGTVSLCAGNTATLVANGASTYTWTSPSATTASISVTPTVTTSYSVTGTGTVNTCTGKSVITVTVTNCLGIEQYSGDNNISVYPNPNNGLVTVSITNVAEGTVLFVTDVIGQEVLKTSIKDINTKLDLSSLQKGIYMITITNGQSKHIEKVIIQ